MKTILDFQNKKASGEKISMVTCYDYWTARILNQSQIDCLLVGDSAAMVMFGFQDTIPMELNLLGQLVAAVRRGAPDKFIVADMPFLAHRKGIKAAMDAVSYLMKMGANAVKIEAQPGHEKIINYIAESGVPVVGHIGLTPQSVHQLGGFKVQGKDPNSALKLLALARVLEQAGCFSLVIECVPESLAKKISKNLKIPTIGIGSGPNTDGQVLVLQDLLGAQKEFHPKFVRQFADVHGLILNAVNTYHDTVVNKQFPSQTEIYH